MVTTGLAGAGWGGGPWFLLFPLLWIVLFVKAFLFRRRPDRWQTHSAEEVLAERYARRPCDVIEVSAPHRPDFRNWPARVRRSGGSRFDDGTAPPLHAMGQSTSFLIGYIGLTSWK